MKLKNVARAFDNTTARDAYNPRVAFRCQIEPLDLYRMDGARIKLRGMSTADDISIPPRGAINVGSQVYIVSDFSEDFWADTVLRRRYVIQGADDLARIQTIPQVLADEDGTHAYASVDFNRYSTDERDSSDYHPQYHIYFSGSEVAPENSIITANARSYLVRQSNKTTAGLFDTLANELSSPVIDSATFSVRTYNPITDTYTDASTTVRCVRVRWQDHFTYLSQGSEKYARGDVQVFVPLSVTPKAGDTITLPDGKFTILSSLPCDGYLSLHVRRA